jgi:uncharacterized protein YdeI (YjbR/CyaY-like superfamily)
MNPLVDEFLAKAEKWQSEMTLLRKIALDCGLTEELKWKQPCYTFNGTNILIISAFKDHCVMSFLKGVLLKDFEQILVSPGANSQSVKFAKFMSAEQITANELQLKAYIFEAIEIEKVGLKIDKTKSTDFELVPELIQKMSEDATFENAFNALTVGRQRAYNMFFSDAKQAETRFARIEKYRDRILKGKGMNDCVCGHSKRMPNCDGSHKNFN